MAMHRSRLPTSFFRHRPAPPIPLSTMWAPAPANARAHLRPIPLVEPVTTAVLPFRILNSLTFFCCMPSCSADQTHLAGFDETSAWLLEVVVHNLPQPERQVGQYVDRGHHLENWQVSYGCQRMRRQMERRRPGPRALYRDVLEMIFDQFADAWRAVDMRNDLEQEVRRRKRSPDLRQIGLAVFVTHRASGNPNGSVIQGTDQRVDLSPQRRQCQFLGKAPKLATAGDRPLVIEEHAVGVAALPAAKRNRDYLPTLSIIAKAVRVRHADEFVFHQRLALVKFERLGHHCPKLHRIRAVGDDQVFTVDEPIRSRWI